MKIVKKQIVTFLAVMTSVIMMQRYCFAEAYDATEVKELSATQFWKKVTDYNDKVDKESEYIICGNEVCKADEQKCYVKTTVRHDLHHQALKKCSDTTSANTTSVEGNSCAGVILGMFINWTRGSKTVTTYEYKCILADATPPDGYTEAPEGGYVQRRKVVTGGKWVDSKVKENACVAGNDNKGYCLMTKEKGESIKKATVEYNRADTAFRGCEVIPVKLYNNRRCFFCKLITIMYAASNHITSISFETFAMPFAIVIAMGLAVWIAVKVLGFVSSVSKQDAPKFLTELIKQSYKVMIAFFLLLFSTQLFQDVIAPVLEAGLKFGSEIVSSAGERSMQGAPDSRILSLEYEDATKIDFAQLEELSPGLPDRLASSILSKTQGEYYNKNLYIKIDSFVVFVQKNIAFMQTVGTSLLCVGGNALVWRGDKITWGDGFQLVLMGLLLASFAFLLIIAFSFYLVDAIVQLGIVGALLPFMIATWPFKITSKYSKVGWNMLLNSAFIFLFSGMVVTVDLALVNSALTYTANNGKNIQASENEEIKTGGLYEIASAINAQEEEKVVELTDISSTGFLILLFCCIYGFQFMGKTSDLAGKFAGGALKPIAPGIATMAGSAAKSLASKSTQHAREAISGKIKNTGKAAWGGVKSVFKGSKGENAAGADETAASMTPNSGDKHDGKSSGVATTNSTKKNSNPVISESGTKGKPVISEDEAENNPTNTEKDGGNDAGAADVNKSDDKEEGKVQNKKQGNKRQTNADMTNAKGSSRYVEQAKKKYDRFNKSKKNPKSSKKNRKPIKTNKRRK